MANAVMCKKTFAIPEKGEDIGRVMVFQPLSNVGLCIHLHLPIVCLLTTGYFQGFHLEVLSELSLIAEIIVKYSWGKKLLIRMFTFCPIKGFYLYKPNVAMVINGVTEKI